MIIMLRFFCSIQKRLTVRNKWDAATKFRVDSCAIGISKCRIIGIWAIVWPPDHVISSLSLMQCSMHIPTRASWRESLLTATRTTCGTSSRACCLCSCCRAGRGSGPQHRDPVPGVPSAGTQRVTHIRSARLYPAT